MIFFFIILLLLARFCQLLLWFSLLVMVLWLVISLNKSSESCLNDEFRCNNGECIYLKEYCDGVPNCHDGSDEEESCSMKKNRIGLFPTFFIYIFKRHFAFLIIKKKKTIQITRVIKPHAKLII